MSRFNIDMYADDDDDDISNTTFGRTSTSQGGMSSLGLESTNKPSSLSLERQRRLQQMRNQKKNQRSQMDSVVSNSNPMSSPSKPLTMSSIGRYNHGNTGKTLSYGSGLSLSMLSENNSGNAGSKLGLSSSLISEDGSGDSSESGVGGYEYKSVNTYANRSKEEEQLKQQQKELEKREQQVREREEQVRLELEKAKQLQEQQEREKEEREERARKQKQQSGLSLNTNTVLLSSTNAGGSAQTSGSSLSGFSGGYNSTPKASSSSSSSSLSSSSLSLSMNSGFLNGPPQLSAGLGKSEDEMEQDNSEVMAMIQRRKELQEKDMESISESERELMAQGIPVSFDPTSNDDDSQENTVFDLSDIRSFIMRACPEKSVIRCRIERDKNGKEKLYPKYRVYLEDGNVFLLAARKRKKSASANYLISLDEDDLSRDSGNYVGKVRSNVSGTQFTMYDKGDNYKKSSVFSKGNALGIRQELALVRYEQNLLGWKGPRKLSVVVPDIKQDGNRIIVKPTCEEEELASRVDESDYKNLRRFKNKQPTWNEATEAYVLNFQGRVSMASVKNFQLIEEDGDEDYIALQFGRIGTDSFTMDVRRPMSPLVAFGICLSSLDSKMMCE